MKETKATKEAGKGGGGWSLVSALRRHRWGWCVQSIALRGSLTSSPYPHPVPHLFISQFGRRKKVKEANLDDAGEMYYNQEVSPRNRGKVEIGFLQKEGGRRAMAMRPEHFIFSYSRVSPPGVPWFCSSSAG